MAIYTMADNGIDITTTRDATMYNLFADNQDLVFGGIGNELECTASNLIVTVNSGECLIQGRHMTVTGTEQTQVSANASGYIVLRYDLTQTAGNEGSLLAVDYLVKNDLNNGGNVRDLPLYTYTSTSNQVTIIDIRNIVNSLLGGVSFNVEGDSVYASYEVDGSVVKKRLGSLDPATLTATQADVLSGKIFGGADSYEAQVGTMPDKSLIDSSVGGINSNYPNVAVHIGSNMQIGTTTVSNQKLISIQAPYGYYYGSYVGALASELGNAGVGDVKAGVTFTSSNGLKLTGTGANIVNSASATLVKQQEWNANWTTQTFSASRQGIAIMQVRSRGVMEILQNGSRIAYQSTNGNSQYAWCWGRVTAASTVTYKWTVGSDTDNRANISCWFIYI